ncbi:hypothetical protein [Hymenobacter lucidus]|uniref:Uncharacterized protein n=1 Tax=Hymenobacter lucidus TaxID=2880930 RepID=A0ABS8AW66_9BACT|nr:hypothetical protein [Hymenobacter lucidus]MCB2409832.1 hypothetical protein [Hymenobacter lucidus]
MKTADTTAKFAFKKTTVTVFNKAATEQVKYTDPGELPASTLNCQWTSIWSSSVIGTLDTLMG